jgi:starch phosphorylase
MWAGYPLDEVPIGSVTNGTHTHSWISMEMSALLNRYLGRQWGEKPADTALWQRVDRIPDQELWRVHEIRRERLIRYSRTRLASQLRQRGRNRFWFTSVIERPAGETLPTGVSQRHRA